MPFNHKSFNDLYIQQLGSPCVLKLLTGLPNPDWGHPWAYKPSLSVMALDRTGTSSLRSYRLPLAGESKFMTMVKKDTECETRTLTE